MDAHDGKEVDNFIPWYSDIITNMYWPKEFYNQEYEENNVILTCKEEETPPENPGPPAEEVKEEPHPQAEEPQPSELIAEPQIEPEPALPTTVDLLVLLSSFTSFILRELVFLWLLISFITMQGLDEINPVAKDIEQSNALALAIIPPGSLMYPACCYALCYLEQCSGLTVLLIELMLIKINLVCINVMVFDHCILSPSIFSQFFQSIFIIKIKPSSKMSALFKEESKRVICGKLSHTSFFSSFNKFLYLGCLYVTEDL